MFFVPSGYPFNSIFWWQYVFIRFVFLMKHFAAQLSQCLWSPNFSRWRHAVRSYHAYIYMHDNGVILWGHMTNKIHTSTCRRCINTTLGKVLTECKRHDPLIRWPTWGQMSVWKICLYFHEVYSIGCWLQGQYPARIHLRHHRLLVSFDIPLIAPVKARHALYLIVPVFL